MDRSGSPVPRPAITAALCDVFDRVSDAASTGQEPPKLQPSIDAARDLIALDDQAAAAGYDVGFAERLDEALQVIAHAAVGSSARIRAARAKAAAAG